MYWQSGSANLAYVQRLFRDIDADLVLPLGACVLPGDTTHPIESTSFLLRGMGIHGLNVVDESPGVCNNHAVS